MHIYIYNMSVTCLPSIKWIYWKLWEESISQSMHYYPLVNMYNGRILAILTSSPKGHDRSPENKQVFLNSSLVSKRFFQLVKGSQLCSLWLTKFWIQSRVVTLLQICTKKWRFKIPTKILSMIMCIQNLVGFCPFILNIWSKNQILASIKGRNSVANLR